MLASDWAAERVVEKRAGDTILACDIQKLLIEESVAGDNELLARRKLLARRDPIACLHQLQRLNRSLLKESERQLDDHVRLSAILRIQMLFRGKTAATLLRFDLTKGGDRKRVRAALTWLKQQRLLLRAEARMVAATARPRLERRALSLCRRPACWKCPPWRCLSLLATPSRPPYGVQGVGAWARKSTLEGAPTSLNPLGMHEWARVMNGKPPMVMHAGRLVSSEYRSAKDTKAGAGLPSRTTEGGRQHSMARGLPPFLPPSLPPSEGPKAQRSPSQGRVLAAYSQHTRSSPCGRSRCPRGPGTPACSAWVSGPALGPRAELLPHGCRRERGGLRWLPGCLAACLPSPISSPDSVPCPCASRQHPAFVLVREAQRELLGVEAQMRRIAEVQRHRTDVAHIYEHVHVHVHVHVHGHCHVRPTLGTATHGHCP